MRILVPVDGSPNSMNSLEFIAGRTTLLGSNQIGRASCRERV